MEERFDFFQRLSLFLDFRRGSSEVEEDKCGVGCVLKEIKNNEYYKYFNCFS